MGNRNARVHLILHNGSNSPRKFRKAVNVPVKEQAEYFASQIRDFFAETNVPSGHKKASADHSITAQFSVRGVGETASVAIHSARFEGDLTKVMDAHAAFIAPQQIAQEPSIPAKETIASGAP